MFNGSTPYGYKWNKEDAKMEENPKEAKILNRIFRMYTNKGLSMKDITIKLNAEGFKSRRAAWTNGTLSGIFNNQVYGTCQLITNRHVYDEGKRTKKFKPENEWIIFPVPRIVSASLWDKVQARRKFNKRKQKHTTWQQEYWLRDNMTCHHCGGKLIAKRGSTRKDGTYPRYYACYWGNTSQKDLKSANRKKCKSTFIQANNLEDHVWQVLSFTLVGGWVDDEEKEELQAEARFSKLFGSENIEKRIKEVKKQIQQSQKELNGKKLANKRFAGELEKNEIDVNYYLRYIRQNEEKIALLESRVSDLENKLAEFKDIQQDKDYWLQNKDLLFDAWKDMQNFTPEDKKQFLESLVPNGIIIFIHPRINKRLIPENVNMEIVYNSDIFKTFTEEGKFPSFSKNGTHDPAGPDL
jgi:site-specific DNA recombinase